VPAKLLEELGLNAASNGEANGHAGANGKANATSHTPEPDEDIPTDLSVE
jgi:hypothetical protein